LPSNAWWSGCQGAGPCQALAAEGGGRKARDGKLLKDLDAGDVVTVTRIDRRARSTFDLLVTLV
jgi:DNA invertase Pin-like site-specific DNA recombinase